MKKFDRYEIIEKNSFKQFDRVQRMIAIDIFNINRSKIIKETEYLYSIGLPFENIITSLHNIFDYDDYNLVEHPMVFIDTDKLDIDKLLKKEVNRIFNNVNKKSYSLFG